MIGYEIIISTGIIVAFILGWTLKIYVQPLIDERENILKGLDEDHNSIKQKVIESESDKEQFIDELIYLWDFQNIRYKFENEMDDAINRLSILMFPEGLIALIISCFYVAIINNIIIIKFANILECLIIFDAVIILILFLQAFSYRGIMKKIEMFMSGIEITEIYSIEDVFSK